MKIVNVLRAENVEYNNLMRTNSIMNSQETRKKDNFILTHL